MTFRSEYKIRLNHFTAQNLKLKLKNYGMKELYPPRKISSLYFDNNLFQSFHQSEEGVTPRKKIRIRSYPKKNNINIDMDNFYNLEFKFSTVEGRFKKSTKILKTLYDNYFTRGIIDNIYGICFPKVNIQYERSYFILDKLRITHDKNIIFSNLSNSIFRRESEEVFEVKTSMNISNDQILKIFHVNNSRFSKYEKAVKKIFRNNT